MSLPTPNVDYTDRDFDSLRARIMSLVTSVFPDWTDQQTATFGTLLVEAMAFVGDNLTFYQDAQAREARWTQATQRRSAIAGAKLIGYVPATASVATAEVEVTLNAVQGTDFTIPAGSRPKTDAVTDPIEFRLLTDLVVPAGQLTGTAIAENSEEQVTQFTGNGAANQEVVLLATPFIDDDLTVSATNGAYTRVDNFLRSTAADRHFTVVVDNNDRATIRFGNGTNGQLPVGVGTIGYKTGGGAEGNVEAGALKRLDGNFGVAFTITNPVRASGGAPRESLAQIKVAAPASLATLTRTVSRTDYETNALRVPGVARALMLSSDQLTSIPENTGRLYIVPDGGGAPTQVLKDAVLQSCTVDYPNTITFNLGVYDAEYKTIDIYSVVHLAKGAVPATVDAAIRSNLADYFALTTGSGDSEAPNPTINFGYYLSQDSDGAFDGTFAFSDLFNVVRDTTGVRKIDDSSNAFLINGVHADVALEIFEFPVLGTVTIINAETGTALV